jgi:hypothetical protein
MISGTTLLPIKPEPKMSAMFLMHLTFLTFTFTAAKDAFTYALENVLENENVTRALKH